MKKGGWEKLSSRIVYKTPWIKVIEDKVIKPDGEKGIYSYLKTNGDSVFVVPLTDNNEVYLVKLFRYIIGKWSWEIPGGNSDGEDLLKAAKRELKEETGLVAKSWENVGNFQAMSGVVGEKGHVFIARGLKETKENKKLEENIVEIKKVSFRKALRMIHDNEITDGHSIITLSKAALFLKI